MKLLYTLLIFAAFSNHLFAQSDRQAERVIADFIRSVEQTSVQAKFELTTLDENNRPMQVQSGTFRMRGDRFSLLTDDFDVFFDGKTQWTYMDAVGEVMITEPTGDDLAEINPIFLLRQYQNKSTIRFAVGNAGANYSIDLTPNAQADFSRIFVQINRSTRNLVSVHLFTRQGFSMQINFTQFQRGVNIPDSYFVFDKSKYDDDIFINDLR